MKLQEITLGSKQHAELIARAMAENKMTWTKFVKALKDSTLSQADCDAVFEEIMSAKGHPRAMAMVVKKSEIEQLAALTGVDEDELFTIAGL